MKPEHTFSPGRQKLFGSLDQCVRMLQQLRKSNYKQQYGKQREKTALSEHCSLPSLSRQSFPTPADGFSFGPEAQGRDRIEVIP